MGHVRPVETLESPKFFLKITYNVSKNWLYLLYQNQSIMAQDSNLVGGKKVNVTLVGTDGNIFALMGTWRNAGRRQGWSKEELDKVTNHIQTNAQSYDEALGILIDHTENIAGEESED